MEELLPYYERELSFLRRYSRDFAERYPKIAARLAMTSEHCEDPHVERMIESFALLGARINKKLDDDYPEFTEALLEVLYPHYLRPFPSCSIAQFGMSAAVSQLTEPQTVPRGTELRSRSIRGVECRFRTAYDLTLAPLSISDAKYLPLAMAPGATVLPPNATGIVSITFASTSPQLDLAALKVPRVRAHLHGEQSFIAALADCLFVNALATYVEPDRCGRWKEMRATPVTQAGFDEADGLIDYPARSHPAYRLLTEYFGFPEKFDFVDFDLGAMTRTAGPCRSLTLHVVLKDVRGDSHMARLLETLSASHLRLFCTPVVNLFRQRGEPIRVSHQAVSYPVIAEGRNAFAYEIYSIDSVHLVRQRAHEEKVIEFRPFYSLHHGETEKAGHYWFARRNAWVAENSPGYETEISIVDIDLEPSAPQTDTLSVDLTCTNRDLPARLAVGLEGGDLFVEGGAPAGSSIAMLRRPTPTARFERGRGAHWRLVSHLALSHVSLANSGLAALKEMLVLYDLRRSAVSSRHIEGIVGIEQRAAVQWLPGKPFATFVRGVEIRLTLDEEHFVGTSVATFVRLLDTFFGLYVHLNSFVQLIVVSKRTGEEILRCKTAQRRVDPGVIERLLDEPHAFEFFQAVRMLERWFSDDDAAAATRTGDVLAKRIGFRSTLSLAFPPSEIEQAQPYDHSGGALKSKEQRTAALANGGLSRVDITPSFFGLLGGQGALPLHYTEQIVSREQLKRDRAAREFFDVFGNRATALFYAAWKKYRLPFHYELDRDERYLPLLLALAGVGDGGTRESLQTGKGALFDEAIAGYALPARHRPVSAAYLQRTLSDYFKVPVRVDQFVGKWYDVPRDQLTVLGQINATLGASALAGERVWQRDMRARLVIGPLSKTDYESFLPGFDCAIALERMLTLLAGVTLEYEVSLVLRRTEVGPSQLGGGARLGWDAFLCTHAADRDRADARYELHVIH